MAVKSGRRKAVFTQGSTMRHVIIMTSTAAIGMMAIFFVDAITLFYISKLNDPAQTAAVGRSGYVIGFLIAVTVGMMIGSSVLIAKSIGQKKYDLAKRYGGSAILGAFVFGLVFAGALIATTDWFLGSLGATGDSLSHAQTYLRIILPGMPFMAIGMICMGILRAWGAAKESMYITLVGGILTAALDPIFIFVLDFQVTGAAIVSLIARLSFAALGLYYVLSGDKLISWSHIKQIISDLLDMAKVGIPAMATNLAAPVGLFLVAQKVAEYGDNAMAGMAVVDRLVPLAFGVIFALSGAVGPIIGQNFGAGLYDRSRQGLIDGVKFNMVYVLFAWAVLYFARNFIIDAYSATGDMALMINLFCTIMAAAFFFNGLLFVTNAAFNNLGKPLWATAFNWSRQTIGVVPFVTLGAMWGDLPGIAYGMVLGSVPFALVAIFVALRLIASFAKTDQV
ncbi:MAG: MATE family efflux transporter [Devosiaceae bacterium]|nr:MATE family efflux transporter [Devosiaceae bacterium]